jgi:hypothetical protein
MYEVRHSTNDMAIKTQRNCETLAAVRTDNTRPDVSIDLHVDSIGPCCNCLWFTHVRGGQPCLSFAPPLNPEAAS